MSGYGTPDEVILSVQDAPHSPGKLAVQGDRPRSATVAVAAEARLLSQGGESFQDPMLLMPEVSFEIGRSLSSRVRGLEAEQRRTEPAMRGQ